jgi:hypothetical protein
MDKQKLFELGMKKRNGELSQSWDELAKGHFVSGNAFRRWMIRQIQKPDKDPEYKETVEIHSNGAQSSNKLLRMSIEQAKDEKFLLEAHGYDPQAWVIENARSNIWNAYSDKSGIMQLYASKITVKPRKAKYTLEQLIAAAREAPPIFIEPEEKPAQPMLLEIPIFDAHFGVSSIDDYRETVRAINDKLSSRNWKQVLFIIGQDLFHNDNFRGQTANGTPIESVDMAQAWKDCQVFYEQLIRVAINKAEAVKIVYSKGNHDESFSWAFVQYLKARFPKAEFDDEMIERKVHVFGSNFIGITHGDKAKKNLHNIFPIEFPQEWAGAKNREIHTGHYHIEDGKDVFGMMVRTLATRNKTDKWHKDNGFVGGHKRFMLFEYSVDALESIHYV